MNAATRRGDDRRVNVPIAKKLAEKLRLTDEPLTEPERKFLASLVHTVADRVDFRPTDTFDRVLAWQTVDAAFYVRARILRGDLPEEAA